MSSNEQILKEVEAIRNGLGPFWNLVSMLMNNAEAPTRDCIPMFDVYKEAERADSVKMNIINSLTLISEAATTPPIPSTVQPHVTDTNVGEIPDEIPLAGEPGKTSLHFERSFTCAMYTDDLGRCDKQCDKCTQQDILPTIQARIEAEYPYTNEKVGIQLRRMHDDMQDKLRAAAQFGYTLAMGERSGEVLSAADWMNQYYNMDSDLGKMRVSIALEDGPTSEMEAYARYYHSAMSGEVRSQWIKVSERPPLCFRSGNFDGLKSDPILVKDKNNTAFVAIAYAGTLDGSKFLDFYDHTNDYELCNITHWYEIPE